MDWSLPGSSFLGILQARILEWVAIPFSAAAAAAAKSLQLCPTLCNPMDCSLPGSSVHGILQARVLKWVAYPFSRGSSQLRELKVNQGLLHCRWILYQLSYQGSPS